MASVLNRENSSIGQTPESSGTSSVKLPSISSLTASITSPSRDSPDLCLFPPTPPAPQTSSNRYAVEQTVYRDPFSRHNSRPPSLSDLHAKQEVHLPPLSSILSAPVSPHPRPHAASLPGQEVYPPLYDPVTAYYAAPQQRHQSFAGYSPEKSHSAHDPMLDKREQSPDSSTERTDKRKRVVHATAKAAGSPSRTWRNHAIPDVRYATTGYELSDAPSSLERCHDASVSTSDRVPHGQTPLTPFTARSAVAYRQSLYRPDEDGLWACLGNPEIRISFDKINDDYCDCPDGSDEPGTSACSLGRFYCANEGFRPSYLPSYKVNDGICDYDLCCDGSDEADGKCPSRCAQMKKSWEEETAARNAVISRGLANKAKIQHKAHKQRTKLKYEITQLSAEIEKLDQELYGLNQLKAPTEKESAIISVFEQLDSKLEDISSQISEKLKQLDAKRQNLRNLEEILESMSNEYNHNFNDPAVKAAAQAFQEYSVNQGLTKDEKRSDQDSEVESLFETLQSQLKDSETEIRKLAGGGDEAENELFDFKSTFKAMVNSFLGVSNRRQKIPSTRESEKRKKEIEDELKRLRRDLHTKEERLNKDYGPQQILMAMDDCIVDKIGDYDYRLCFVEKVEQIDRNGHAVRIGRFERTDFDEEKQQLKLIYEHGDKCWNGPVRKATVQLECGEKNTIVAVTEPEKCEYTLRVKSPIGCFEPVEA
ncbi:hypothetical protein OGATHE_006673 [Ogataea polymorpha]|uniref:Glucosidase 2 subunit beta n=1 Tax=Ogataea polymorpha TaxID=460523 RepID=A0A9P8NTL0_9ASCO|nr:hypothetical protein OGATHE_006673 [Ogataea polymorpha]